MASRKIKFGLRALLLLIFVASLALAWLSYQRGHNSDRLAKLFADLGAEKVEVTSFAPPVNSYEPFYVMLQKELLGNKARCPGELRFFGLTREACEHLQSSNATDRVTDVHFISYLESVYGGSFAFPKEKENAPAVLHPVTEPFFEGSSPMFFRNWPRLRRIVFRDTSIPRSWHDRFAELPALEEVVISGAACNLEPEKLIGCANLKRLVLCQRGISQKRLKELQSQMPGVKIDLLGCFERSFKFETKAALSEHDPQAYERMKKTLDDIDVAIKKAGGTNFVPGPPATEEEIAALEQGLGVPLSPELRAFYEVTNGWPKAPTFIWNGIASTQNALKRYNSRLGLVYAPDEYDFDVFSFREYGNPSAIPLCDDVGMPFNEPFMCDIDPDGEDGPTNLRTFGLLHVFEGVLAELKTDKHDIREGRAHVWGDFWYE